MISGCMALSVIAVSISVSPLRMEEELVNMFMTSAPSRLPASSKEAWVRVETSKNRLMSVRPRSETCFLSIWRLSSTKSSARSSSPTISSRESPSIPNRWRWLRTKVDLAAMFIKAASIGPAGGSRKGARGVAAKAVVDVRCPSPRVASWPLVPEPRRGEGCSLLQHEEWVRGFGCVSTAGNPLTPTLSPRGEREHIVLAARSRKTGRSLGLHPEPNSRYQCMHAPNSGARMERAMRMEEVLNQSPPYVDVNLYDSDRPLRD